MSEHTTGQDLLFDALRTKGTAFTHEERRKFGLLGLLPTAEKTLDEQAEHSWREFTTRREGLDQHIYLRALQDRNETLFYRVLTTTSPRRCRSSTPRRSVRPASGSARSIGGPADSSSVIPHREHLREVLRNRPQSRRDVDVIVVTDGERILGLGDQGIGGMGIPIGKLSLYTLIGGIDPARTLPIVLDVGTDNVELLEDPQYLGWRHRRINDDDYFAFVDEFVAAVHEESAGCASPVGGLRHRARAADPRSVPRQVAHLQRRHPGHRRRRPRRVARRIQGRRTPAVAAAGRDARRGLGRHRGPRHGAARDAVAGIVRTGCGGTHLGRRHPGTAHRRSHRPFRGPTEVRPAGEPRRGLGPRRARQLADVVHHVDVGVLLGLSTAAGAFTEDIVRELASKTERPIIFPLSNPTSRAEAHPAELDEWTDGRALIATGSPFAPLHRDGVERPVAQCNNVYIFPAMGLAVTAAQATRVTDEMMRAAAAKLGDASPALATRTSRCCLRGRTSRTSRSASLTPSLSKPSRTASRRSGATTNWPHASPRCAGRPTTRRCLLSVVTGQDVFGAMRNEIELMQYR